MSPTARKTLTIASGLLALVAGFFGLNYTKAFGVEHHFEWAASRGMPEPSPAIFLAGAALVAFGGLLLGLAFRR